LTLSSDAQQTIGLSAAKRLRRSDKFFLASAQLAKRQLLTNFTYRAI
jgi:hypothetical protein